eukprot:13092405-Alexandrium_andersonii.AAC.1
MCFYACVVTPVAAKVYAGVQSGIVDALDRKLAKHRSPLAAMLAHSKDMSPLAYVALQRVRSLRKAWHAFPHLRE